MADLNDDDELLAELGVKRRIFGHHKFADATSGGARHRRCAEICIFDTAKIICKIED